jgi:hypothetical protein
MKLGVVALITFNGESLYEKRQLAWLDLLMRTEGRAPKAFARGFKKNAKRNMCLCGVKLSASFLALNDIASPILWLPAPA